MRDIDLEYYEGLLREIGEIVRTPTKETRHRVARDHFQADFDAIRKIVAIGLTRPIRNTKSAPDFKAAQNTAEGDPSVMPDWSGADTHSTPPPAHHSTTENEGNLE